MMSSHPHPRQSNTPLLRWLIGTAAGLAVVHGVVLLTWGPGPVIAVFPWYVPTMHGFAVLAALGVALLAVGRYQVRREPALFWVGTAFSSFALLGLFYVLSWPGLLSDERGLIARLPNTAGWYWNLKFSLLAALLLAAGCVRWPKAGTWPERRWFWLLVAALAAIAAAASLSIAFEPFLPGLVVKGTWTPLQFGWLYVLLLAFAAGAALSGHRYRRTGDSLLGYVALAQLALAFGVLAVIIGGKRYDLWWYWYRVLLVGSFSTMLFGLLAEYVALYQREQQKTRELEALQAESQRRAAELQGILDNMVDAVFVCDAEGRITLANESAIRLFGFDMTEVKRPLAGFPAWPPLRYHDGRPIASENLPLARALRGDTIEQENLGFVHPRSQRDTFVRVSAAPIRDETGRIAGAVAVARDVTELTELDRLKDQFFAVAAHELRTPVTVMKGYAQMLLRTAGEVPPRDQMLVAIDRGANRIARIVQDLLDVSQLHVGHLEMRTERIDLAELVGQVIGQTALATAKHRIRLVHAETAVVQGDREHLKQALVNLINNAVKYSPEGGDVDVAVAVQDREAVVSVRDFGAGISQAKQARIFQRFYSAHTGTPHDFGGLGVGLYLSKEIVTHHGGRMWFESAEGLGSTFSFSLPLAGG